MIHPDEARRTIAVHSYLAAALLSDAAGSRPVDLGQVEESLAEVERALETLRGLLMVARARA